MGKYESLKEYCALTPIIFGELNNAVILEAISRAKRGKDVAICFNGYANKNIEKTFESTFVDLISHNNFSHQSPTHNSTDKPIKRTYSQKESDYLLKKKAIFAALSLLRLLGSYYDGRQAGVLTLNVYFDKKTHTIRHLKFFGDLLARPAPQEYVVLTHDQKTPLWGLTAFLGLCGASNTVQNFILQPPIGPKKKVPIRTVPFVSSSSSIPIYSLCLPKADSTKSKSAPYQKFYMSSSDKLSLHTSHSHSVTCNDIAWFSGTFAGKKDYISQQSVGIWKKIERVVSCPHLGLKKSDVCSIFRLYISSMLCGELIRFVSRRRADSSDSSSSSSSFPFSIDREFTETCSSLLFHIASFAHLPLNSLSLSLCEGLSHTRAASTAHLSAPVSSSSAPTVESQSLSCTLPASLCFVSGDKPERGQHSSQGFSSQGYSSQEYSRDTTMWLEGVCILAGELCIVAYKKTVYCVNSRFNELFGIIDSDSDSGLSSQIQTVDGVSPSHSSPSPSSLSSGIECKDTPKVPLCDIDCSILSLTLSPGIVTQGTSWSDVSLSLISEALLRQTHSIQHGAFADLISSGILSDLESIQLFFQSHPLDKRTLSHQQCAIIGTEKVVNGGQGVRVNYLSGWAAHSRKDDKAMGHLSRRDNDGPILDVFKDIIISAPSIPSFLPAISSIWNLLAFSPSLLFDSTTDIIGDVCGCVDRVSRAYLNHRRNATMSRKRTEKSSHVVGSGSIPANSKYDDNDERTKDEKKKREGNKQKGEEFPGNLMIGGKTDEIKAEEEFDGGDSFENLCIWHVDEPYPSKIFSDLHSNSSCACVSDSDSLDEHIEKRIDSHGRKDDSCCSISTSHLSFGFERLPNKYNMDDGIDLLRALGFHSIKRIYNRIHINDKRIIKFTENHRTGHEMTVFKERESHESTSDMFHRKERFPSSHNPLRIDSHGRKDDSCCSISTSHLSFGFERLPNKYNMDDGIDLLRALGFHSIKRIYNRIHINDKRIIKFTENHRTGHEMTVFKERESHESTSDMFHRKERFPSSHNPLRIESTVNHQRMPELECILSEKAILESIAIRKVAVMKIEHIYSLYKSGISVEIYLSQESKNRNEASQLIQRVWRSSCVAKFLKTLIPIFREAADQSKLIHTAAKNIQRVWRGHCVRRKHYSFYRSILQGRKKIRERQYQEQRKKDLLPKPFVLKSEIRAKNKYQNRLQEASLWRRNGGEDERHSRCKEEQPEKERKRQSYSISGSRGTSVAAASVFGISSLFSELGADHDGDRRDGSDYPSSCSTPFHGPHGIHTKESISASTKYEDGTPPIPPMSTALLSPSSVEGQDNFWGNQVAHGFDKKQRIEDGIKEMEEHSGKPTINQFSLSLATKHGKSFSERQEFYKKKAKNRLKSVTTALEKEQREKIPFKPSINPMSKDLRRSTRDLEIWKHDREMKKKVVTMQFREEEIPR
ncbi:hypothetical protein ADUPG1_006434, partial [Aduncisulcus paluster]